VERMKNRKWLATAIMCALTLGLTIAAMGGTTDNHGVTVTVGAINELAVLGGNITITIDTATAGSDPNSEADSDTCDLAWTTNESSKKITVASTLSLAAQKFTLKAVAQSVSGGTAASEVTLSDVDTIFVSGVAATIGSCDISYTATALASEGTGSDVHTVTYTLTSA